VDVGTGIGINGSDPTLTNDPADLQKIDQVKVNISTRSSQNDLQTGQQIVNSITTIAELEN
jgi:hypothetical protein